MVNEWTMLTRFCGIDPDKTTILLSCMDTDPFPSSIIYVHVNARNTFNLFSIGYPRIHPAENTICAPDCAHVQLMVVSQISWLSVDNLSICAYPHGCFRKKNIKFHVCLNWMKLWFFFFWLLSRKFYHWK